jgi:REP element-mobilizing transposase RayT
VPPGDLVEVTCTTVQRRFLLRPSRDLVEITHGLIARAGRLYPVDVVDFVVLSNHMHLLLVARDSEALSAFMEYVNGNLAKEAGRLHEWREKFWGRRFQSVPVTDEEEAQVGCLRYLLEHGCKEGLVRSPLDWPGARGTRALLEGRPVQGVWFSRTAEYEARRRGRAFGKYDYAEEEALELVPLPCWAHLPAEEYRDRVRAMVQEIERETRAAQVRTGRAPLGRRRILGLHPHAKPDRSKRSPRPLCHAASKAARIGFRRAYLEFRLAFRQAAEDLRSGLRAPEFPIGSFPPGLPYVRSRAP